MCNKEKHPCLCDICLEARDNELKRAKIAQREKLTKTFDKTIGTSFEIAENNFKAGQKKERENMIKEALETFKKLKKTAEVSGESMFLWEMENQIKALKDNE